MLARLAALTLLNIIATCGAIAAARVPVQPFHADYQVLRNGKAIGKATLSLRDSGDGAWEFDSHTRGTSGMASLLGLDVTEISTFTWHEGHPQGLRYRYQQDAAIESRTRDIDFDWNNATATVNDGKKKYHVTLQPDAIDRSLVTIALMGDLQRDAAAMAYLVVHKDKISREQYSRRGGDWLDLPAGRIDAVRVERDDGSSKRHTTSWFAPDRGWLPVKIEQVGKHGDTITMQLAAPAR